MASTEKVVSNVVNNVHCTFTQSCVIELVGNEAKSSGNSEIFHIVQIQNFLIFVFMLKL